MDEQIISSHDIEDNYLTDKVSVAKLIRVSLGIKNKLWFSDDIKKSLWQYYFTFHSKL